MPDEQNRHRPRRRDGWRKHPKARLRLQRHFIDQRCIFFDIGERSKHVSPKARPGRTCRCARIYDPLSLRTAPIGIQLSRCSFRQIRSITKRGRCGAASTFGSSLAFFVALPSDFDALMRLELLRFDLFNRTVQNVLCLSVRQACRHAPWDFDPAEEEDSLPHPG